MEWVRVSRSVYGQAEVAGASWDPLYLFVLAGIAVVVLHALYKAVTGRKVTVADKS